MAGKEQNSGRVKWMIGSKYGIKEISYPVIYGRGYKPEKKINMKKQTLVLITLLLGFALSVFAQKVSDIQVRVKGDKILVGYTISGLKYFQDISQVDFYVSRDGGRSFEGPLKDISGDTGFGLRNGKYVMVWDVLREMPLTNEELIFDVRLSITEKPRKKAFMISLVGNTTTPLGLRVGQLGKVGWYAEFRASLSPFTTSEYMYDNETIPDYDKAGYYEFNGNKGFAAWSAVAGVTFQASWKVFFNVGVGYGVENYMYQIDEYTYNTEVKTGTAWVIDNTYSNSGFELDAGLILKFNKFIISGGATTINFKTINWLAGIGVAF